jgi:hypothetical protein
LKEIEENKRIYPVEAGTAIIGRREIHLIKEQRAATIRKRERYTSWGSR